MTRPILTASVGFAPSAVDKVERLLEVLGVFHGDALLRDAFVLHGGTALNLFYDDAPRLSVDIDLMYVAERDVEAMRAARPDIDHRIRRVLEGAGYVVQATNDEHSGQTYRVKYPGDYLKVDVSYLARVPVLKPQALSCVLATPQVAFPVLDERELIAGKVKAMMERLAARDLFDLYRLARRVPDAFDDPRTRVLTIRAISAADPFPFVVSPQLALGRYRAVAGDFAEPLTAMLRPEDVVDFEDMLDVVGGWLSPLSSLTDSEAEYFRRLDEEALYAPELLLAPWPDALERALADPVLAWKVRNLGVRLGGGESH